MFAMKQFRCERWCTALCTILAVLTFPAGVAQADTGGARDASAGEILQATGVRGGLIVHFGCGNGKLTAALGAGNGYLVHGLDADENNVRAARKHIRAIGLYGKVSVDRWQGGGLPYIDNVVNLFVCEQPPAVAQGEILRVLAPGGVAYIREADKWVKIVKPRPEQIDDWTHSFYDATNNAVSNDAVVAPPYHLQWVAEPRYTRSHEHASVSVVVSAAGRMFAIVDEAPAASTALPSQWFLLARDAFSGVLLWKRLIPQWDAHPAGLYKGPPEISRRLVACGDRLYVTLGAKAPVTALDAATGQTVMTYAGTEGTGEILYRNGWLFLVGAGPVARPGKRLEPLPVPGAAITVVDAKSGLVLWKRSDAHALSGTLAVGSGKVFYVDTQAVVCLDAETGRQIWRTQYAAPPKRYVWRAPTLVVHDKVVLCADRRPAPASNLDEVTGKRIPQWLATAGAPCDLTAYSADTGKKLWSCPCAESYYTPVDVFVHDGLVWVGQTRSRQGPDYTVGRDLLTGEMKRRIDTSEAFHTTMPHHRCHRDRATQRYLITGRTGVEFIDLQSGECFRHHWVRGVCRFGTIPCNGLLYTPPHSCACFIEAKLNGFRALAPASATRSVPETVPETGRLQRGPAYSTPQPARPNKASATADSPHAASTDWPTYRHDAARSGATDSTVPDHLTQLWQHELGGRVTSPVIAEGRLFVASIDQHTVHAFDAVRGVPLWQYTAGGRIDSPPTVSMGLVVFGSADGWVYCIRAADGELVWRRRAAPIERRLVAFGQLESPWPVHGSVLVQHGAVYCAAGRSSYLDSGIYLTRIDLQTGRKLAEKRLYSRAPRTGTQPDEPIMFEMPGALPDVLSSDGSTIYMRRLGFDPQSLQATPSKQHLYSPAGFLDDRWWHRTYWIYGDHFYSGYIGWRFAGHEAPSGRLLVLDEATVYGFAREPSRPRGAGAHPYHLFAADKKDLPETGPPDYARAARDYNPRGRRKFKVKFRWTAEVPILVRAMVLANDRLVIAGPPANALRSLPAFEGKQGGGLLVVSTADGKTLEEYRLDSPPAFDALAAANGRLYLTTQSGRVVCLGNDRPRSGVPRPRGGS